MARFRLGRRAEQATRLAELEAIAGAVDRSQCVVEFNLDGTIVDANENFLRTMGYTLQDVRGRNHAMFVDPASRETAEYRAFWAGLARGELSAGQYSRLAKDGREVWLQATYSPVLDAHGQPNLILKIAADVTETKRADAERLSQILAIGRSQAVIEFALDGTILAANDLFLRTMGYTLDEVCGRNHAMFVEPAMRDSPEYRRFWADLGRGEFKAAEFKRLAKGGREVWLQATYNPVLGAAGRPGKVLKLATDVTEAKLRNADHIGQIEAIHRSQAVIEFALDGTILTANENFLRTMGYRLSEIVGRHHSMFVDPAARQSADYKQFWTSLAAGEFRVSEFKRVARDGRPVWLRASYNPVLDLNGRPCKVVKIATDITKQAIARGKFGATFDSLATDAEEMNTSIRDIAATMQRSKATAGDAVRSVAEAGGSAERLSTAARDMGRIVDLINRITGQINLLALNATIESARAGEAGRGFAVVANEVKGLATQAKSATAEIAQEIGAVQSTTNDVVQALVAIRESIDTVSSYVTETSASVEQQNQVTHRMSDHMRQAVDEARHLSAA